MRRHFDPAGRRALAFETDLTVRFSEVDSLGMIWHGNYLHYFEEARDAFGRAHGLSCQDLQAAGLTAPVVELQVYYHHPGRYGDDLRVQVYFLWTEAAKIEIWYEVRRASDRRLLAEGRSVQVFTSLAGDLVLTQPALLQAVYARWPDASQG